ncbi:MAG TPA: hypothetical protein PLM14_01365 [Candidatus Hydrogenedentes bacterium]|nr:hypothetical protein [Candidatus Hydrogenedentota bacterium]HQH52827.1 hypothetical protein [Candidatus Hydrogenedentota bacterium]
MSGCGGGIAPGFLSAVEARTISESGLLIMAGYKEYNTRVRVLWRVTGDQGRDVR